MTCKCIPFNPWGSFSFGWITTFGPALLLILSFFFFFFFLLIIFHFWATLLKWRSISLRRTYSESPGHWRKFILTFLHICVDVTSFLGPHGASCWKGSLLGLVCCCHHFEILSRSLTRAPTFSFWAGPANSVADPASHHVNFPCPHNSYLANYHYASKSLLAGLGLNDDILTSICSTFFLSALNLLIFTLISKALALGVHQPSRMHSFDLFI